MALPTGPPAHTGFWSQDGAFSIVVCKAQIMVLQNSGSGCVQLQEAKQKFKIQLQEAKSQALGAAPQPLVHTQGKLLLLPSPNRCPLGTAGSKAAPVQTLDLPRPCHLPPFPCPLQASLMARGGDVSDGGMSTHIPEETSHLTRLLAAHSPAGLHGHRGSPALIGKVTPKIHVCDPTGTSDAPGSQRCSWRCCKSGGGGFSCHHSEARRVFLAALLCRLLVTLSGPLVPHSSLPRTVGQGAVGLWTDIPEHAPCAMWPAGASGTVLVVAGDTGKCSGEDPALGGHSCTV